MDEAQPSRPDAPDGVGTPATRPSAAPPGAPAAAPSRNPFRVFNNRQYALYFGGQLVSQVGTWMQQIALSWLTYKLTQSAFMLALVGVSSQLPSLLVMPFAGVLSDRFNRHRMLVVTQACAMAQATTLAWLTLSGALQVWHLVALGLVMGVVNAFDMPVRTAFVGDMVVDKADLPAAIAMNSSLMNISRLLGPAVAGFVVAALGEGVCFAINAGSYVAVIAALLLIRGDFSPAGRRATRDRAIVAAGGTPPRVEPPQPGVFSALKEGVLYAARTTPIRAPILLLAVFGFGGMAYAMLMPVFVKSIGGDANTLGYLSSASALGSVLGTAFLATRKSVVGLGQLAMFASFTYALALFGFGFAHSLWGAVPVLVCLGASMMLQMGCCNTILQSVVDEDKRGRVMSLFTMAFMATIPLGSLAGGAIASRYGFHAMVFCCAGYCLLVAIGFASQMPRLRRETRPHYVRRGLISAEEEVDVLSHPGA